VSYHKYKWFVLFYDDYSSHSWISLLYRKSDTTDAIETFYTMVKTQFGLDIVEWMFDRREEFDSERLNTFLKSKRIKVYHSAPYTLL